MVQPQQWRWVSGSRIGLLILAAGFAAAQPATGVRAAARTASQAASSSCSASPGVRPLIRGLVDRNLAPPAPNLDASSINVPWNALEPTGPTLAANNLIDQAIAASGCAPLRIRVLAGIATPGWVLPDSGSVSVINPYGNNNTPATAGMFWTPGYQTDYDNFERLLAETYGAVSSIVEFVVSRCALFYPEPFLLGTSLSTNDTNLVNAGYTEAADQQCLQEEIDTAAADWPAQRIGASFNPYQVLTKAAAAPGYTTGVDESYTDQMMAYCRYTLGSRCVLENDSIRDPISGLGSNYQQMYAAMSGASGAIQLTLDSINAAVTLGAPIAFQTATAANIGDFWGTLLWARKNHAASVELPVDGTYSLSGGTGAQTWQTLAEVARWFTENPTTTAIPLTVEQGQSTLDDPVATVTLDETAAVDTAAGYGDVGSVPFDTVTAAILWPTGVQQTGLISIGGAPGTASATCAAQPCAATVESAGYPFPEEQITSPASVMTTLATGGVQYVPAGGIPITVTVPVTSVPAPLTLTSLSLTPGASRPTAKLLAHFADADSLGTLSNYTARIFWGDGSKPGNGTVSVSGSGFAVAASHHYSHSGKFTVKITISDSGGATVSGSQPVTVH
jgi:hypothetical protein